MTEVWNLVSGPVAHYVAYGLLLIGAFFFISGTLGILRFPDIYTRLHAVAKADTLGLGFVVVGLSLISGSVRASLLMILAWVLVMASGATACQLLARYDQEHTTSKEHRDDR